MSKIVRECTDAVVYRVVSMDQKVGEDKSIEKVEALAVLVFINGEPHTFSVNMASLSPWLTSFTVQSDFFSAVTNKLVEIREEEEKS